MIKLCSAYELLLDPVRESMVRPIVLCYEIVQRVFWTENNPNSIYLKRKFTSLFKQCLNLRKALVIIVEPEVQFYNLVPSKLL